MGKLAKILYGDVGVVAAFITPFPVVSNSKETSATLTFTFVYKTKGMGSNPVRHPKKRKPTATFVNIKLLF